MEKIFNFLLKHNLLRFSKKEKFNLLNTIKAISDSGQDEKKAISNKIAGYRKKTGKSHLAFLLSFTQREIEKGIPLVEALKRTGIINNREYHILKNTKGSISTGINKIIETGEKSSKSMAAFMLMLIPPSIMLLTLVFTHDLVKQILMDMLSPIRSAGGTPPEIKPYLLEPNIYYMWSGIFFGVIFSVIIGLLIVKKYYPKKYLSLFPIIEEEYVLDILKSIRTVSSGGGINMANTAKALQDGEPNNVKNLIFSEIVKRTSSGREKISEVFEDFGINFDTISSIKIGEDANSINLGLDIATTELEKKYERDINFFLKSSMWIGQFSMIGIAGKPMIDIMLLMSVGQLDFKL